MQNGKWQTFFTKISIVPPSQAWIACKCGTKMCNGNLGNKDGFSGCRIPAVRRLWKRKQTLFNVCRCFQTFIVLKFKFSYLINIKYLRENVLPIGYSLIGEENKGFKHCQAERSGGSEAVADENSDWRQPVLEW